MFKFLLILFLTAHTVSAQDLIENKRLELIYQAKNQKVLNKLKHGYLNYIKKSDEFHEDCERIKDHLMFQYATYTIVEYDRITWEYFYHHLEGKKCIRISFPVPEFLNAEDASLLLYISRKDLWQQLPWMAQIKLNYSLYRNYVCNLAQFHKPSDKDNYVIEYNLCGDKKLVRGSFLFESGPVILRL